MLSEKIKHFWKRIPFVWKSFLIYVPLFAGVFTFFLYLALLEIKSSSLERAKTDILEKIETIRSEDFDLEELNSLAGELQLVIFSANSLPLIEINHFISSDPLILPHQFQSLLSNRVILYNAMAEINGQKYLLQAAKNMQPEIRVINSIQNFFFLIIFSGLFISAALSIPLTKLSLKGIRMMAETAEQISYEHLSRRIEVTGADDEFDLLASTLNQMIDRIQISAEAQKKFISNASHELRTPIAVIKGYAQLLTRWGHENPAILKESAEAINMEIEAIQSLLEDLLLMTRVDSKLTDLKVEELNISTLLQQSMKDNRILYPDRSFSLSQEADGEPAMMGDQWLLKAMLRIFTENANKYSPMDRPVDYILQRDGENLILKIADHGEGIADLHKEKVFQRFYRVDEARSREKGGAGLGMAIAKKIITLHKGSVKIEDTPKGGATISITLPAILQKGDESHENGNGSIRV